MSAYNLRSRVDMAAVAPMDLITKDEPATTTTAIPLKCCICPKKPTFSDLSHLLTHVSSKSHLARKWEKEIRKDEQSVKDYNEYKEWETRHGILELAAERLLAKEQKKTGGGTRRSRVTTAASASTVQNSRHELDVDDRALNMMKAEPEDYDQIQPMTTPWANSISGARHFSVVGHNNHLDVSGYQTPVLKGISHEFSVPSTPGAPHSLSRRSLSDPEVAESIETSELASERQHISDDDSDMNKLKGIIYPGMGLFDSASEYQKRRRNQRKDASVLRNMIETSSIITATEYVWDEGGEFQRKRDIYSTPSIEGSPERKLEDSEKSKKKRGRRTVVPITRRTSTRTTRKTAAMFKRDHDQDDDDFDDQEEDKHSRFSSHTHGSADSIAIFRDPSKPSTNTQGLWTDFAHFPSASVGPAPTGLSRTQNPMEETGFDYRRRAPLQSMSTNLSLGSSAPDNGKPLSFFPSRESGASAFSTQQLISSRTYYTPQQHTISGGNFNPLCQTRPNQLTGYGFAGYGNDNKPSLAGFQSINSMAPNLNNLSFNAYNQYETQETNLERVSQDFDA
ncbi:hypothetical protein QBC43DRAFT_106509 [Cladorrhinum sp. PSN259]|nr:hypothetical protein QBC43DRAFT_106509 [Cladorrhinum sp. PSN259]